MERIVKENLKNDFMQVDNLLSQIEVRGDSVGHLFRCRMILMELFSKIEEEKEEDS